MASFRFTFRVLCLSIVLLKCLCSSSATAEDDRKDYIVYMGALPSDSDYSPMSQHTNILQEVTSSVEDSLVMNYGRSFDGFVARLTEAEREKLSSMGGVVSIFPSEDLEIQTTRSWDFMGFGDNIKHNPEVESNIVVGVIDGGIWPESKSFADEGFGPPPKTWKGICKGGLNFTCNKKVIGARYYVGDTARDSQGHGTHTASTAAGNKVEHTSFYGLAEGTARGGVPSARIAAYRVCEKRMCNTAGILAAFDDAIADGVDVITLSVGGQPKPFETDPISIGAFHAMGKGILTVNAAGNDGLPRSTGSVSPWLLSVAASSTDRSFATKVVLGNGKELNGRSINAFKINGTKFPFAYGKSASSTCGEEDARSCVPGCVDQSVKGKILVCDLPESFSEAISLGAVGIILQTKLANPTPPVSLFPLSVLLKDDYASLISYIQSTKNPEGTILRSEVVKDTSAPVVASFSSRGPNTIVLDILKPDITAPGVNILAAYPPVVPAVVTQPNYPGVPYNFLSGTSMACPHVAGVAAYVKSLHPDWSPSAIKSAIMTTAWMMNASSTGAEVNEFAYGSGHVNPTKAADPGLVYEATPDDYLKMLCAMNYTTKEIQIIAGGNASCPKGSKLNVRDLNYPSINAWTSSSSSSSSSSSKPSEITFSRTVTNVGTANSTYKAHVTSASELHIQVKPDTLSFKSFGEKISFTVTVSGISPTAEFQSGSLVWSDGSHIVRSPIVIAS